MADFDLTLTIDGTAYDLAGRSANLLAVQSWGWDLDGDSFIEFSELSADLSARWNGTHDVSLSLTVGATTTVVAAGRIASRQLTFTDQGLGYGYQVLGFKYLANQLPIVATDGTNRMLFNVSPIDADDYIEANAGMTVGAILAAVLTQHSAALAAIGVSTDATTTTQLDALTLVPPEAVVVSGSRLAQAVELVLQKWARNVVLYITPDGLIRFLDTTTGTALTLTYGADPILYPAFDRDWKDCATRVQVVGAGRIFPAYVSLLKSTLAASWTSTQQTDWTFDDYSKPGDCSDAGTVTTVGGPTSVTVQSGDAAVHWVAEFWNGRKAWIYLTKSIGTGLTYQESRPITDCTALTAGGTSDVTLAFDLENSATDAYDSYQIIGNPALLGDGGLNDVWRLFDVTDPGALIADHLVNRFPTAVAFQGYNGTSTQETYYPQALIVKNGVTIPATFKILPASGQILFDQPICAGYTSQSDMNTGGASVTAPDDVYMLLAYSRGALTAVAPADVSGVAQHEGTAYTVDGLERTLTIPVDSWIYAGNQTQMEQLAQMYLDSMKDAVVTGSLVHHGLLEDVLSPGVLLSVAATNGTTGYEALGVPVRGVRFELPDDGRSLPRSTLRCSSRRNPRCGDRAYLHPTKLNQLGFHFDWGGLGVSVGQVAGYVAANLPGGNP